MGFSQNIVNLVLVKCKRSCCICHKFCGTKIELHHIKQVAEGGEDTEVIAFLCVWIVMQRLKHTIQNILKGVATAKRN